MGLFWQRGTWGEGLSSTGDKAAVMLKRPFVLSEVDFEKQKSKPGLFLTLVFVQALNRCFKALVRQFCAIFKSRCRHSCIHSKRQLETSNQI